MYVISTYVSMYLYHVYVYVWYLLCKYTGESSMDGDVIGAIVGGVIGGIMFLIGGILLIILVIYCVCKRNNTQNSGT